MIDLNKILTSLRADSDRHLEEFKALLAMPSVSTLPEHKADVLMVAQWLAAQLADLGMEQVEVVPTEGHPIVYGEWLHAPDKPTVLIYGHYDVQPVDPLDEWESDPFEATVQGDYIVARGASDMKGQLFAQLKAMEAIAAQGEGFPVNIKYLLEGEEEIGSPHLPGFIEEYAEKLACDVVLNCDGGIHAPDQPSIVYALRGLAYFDLEVRTAEKDLHSGLFGGSILNPVHVLAELIAGLHDDQGCVTLPGFYDKVVPLEEDECADLAKTPYNDEAFLAMAGVQALAGETGYSTVERVGARPALEVNGIWGGFTGDGAKTVLPARANAKLSMRLVADQDECAIKGQLEAYMAAHVPEGVQWSVHEHSTGPGATMDRNSPYMRTAMDALETTFGVAPIFKREGGSVPVVGILQRLLGVDSIMMGFALPGDGIHGPNERQHLPTFFKGMEAYARLLLGL